MLFRLYQCASQCYFVQNAFNYSASQQVRGMATEKQSKFVNFRLALPNCIRSFLTFRSLSPFSLEPNPIHKEHPKDYLFDENGFRR